nr:envelope protein E1 [Norway rat hepacivirus 2]
NLLKNVIDYLQIQRYNFSDGLPEHQTFGLVPLTNCCNYSQVQYCSEKSCLHDAGCTICEQTDEGVRCWLNHGPMVSRHPDYEGVDPQVAEHIDAICGLVFLCDLSGINEICGAVALVSSWWFEFAPIAIQLNTTAECYLLEATGADPGFLGFLGWVASEAKAFTAVLDFVVKLPAAVAAAFGSGHMIALASIIGMAMNGHSIKATALLVLYVESAV